ncbi:hypothetical protein QQF64_030213 [Cirrhinus molitorella]|uniref:Uncharacterized protein n=1 Tax=Cirrhinus molitorella TaxID=172907 RepID=A0ABR3N2Z8_9TELE
MSTIDYAFLLSPDLTLQTPLQERDQRHTCTKPSPPLSIFSLSSPASVPSFQKVDFVPICSAPASLMITYAHIHFLICRSLHPPVCLIPVHISSHYCSYKKSMKSAPLTNSQGELIDKCFIFHLMFVLHLLCFVFLVVTVKLRLDR